METLFSRQIWIRLAIVLALVLLLIIVFFARPNKDASKSKTAVVLQPLAVDMPEEDVAEQKGIVIANTQPLIIASDRPMLDEPGLTYAKKTTQTSKPATSKPKEVPKQIEKSSEELANRVSPVKSEVAKVAPVVTESKPKIKTNLFAGLPDDAWLLQLGSALSQADAQKRCGALALACVGYPAVRNDKSVWILVSGPYSSREEALSKVSELPVSIQQQKPFARTVKAVRQDAGA